MSIQARIPKEELAAAPRVWLRNGAGPRIRVIDPDWYRRAMARARARARDAAGEKAPAIPQHLIDAYRAPVGPAAKIIASIAEMHGVTTADVLGRSRVAKIKAARFHVCFELRQQGRSYAQIGGMLNRDHASVLHACREWPALATRLGITIVEGQKTGEAA